MNSSKKHIAILESSEIIYEGLYNFIIKNIKNCIVHHLEHWYDIGEAPHQYDAVLMNPRMVENRLKEFIKIKNNLPHTSWVGLIYNYFDDEILQKFNFCYKLTENSQILLSFLNNKNDNNKGTQPSKELSDREIEVLKLLTQGFSNKEIADKLFISTHTVISHRKNIVEKTGIKSLPGLTIYAISKHITSINQFGR